MGSGPGVLPYMGYIGMCGPKGYSFLSCFGQKLGIDFGHLVSNRVWFLHSSLELVCCLEEATFSSF